MAEAYITQSYSWNTGDTITAARLNGNISNIISGLQDGDKAINVLKVLGANQQFITADGSNITLENVDTYSGKDTITIHKAENDGNPSILIGAGAAERLEINTVFDTGAQTLDYVEFKTKAASATANKGKFVFSVDESNVLEINDSGLSLTGGLTLTSDITSTGAAIDWDLIDNNASALSFDSAGKEGIISIVTTNAAEGVTMSGTLGVTGAVTLSSTLGVTGAISGATATDTINGIVINTGAVSGVTTLTMSGNLTVDTNTLFVDSTNNRVGIGTDTPDGDLEIESLAAASAKLYLSGGTNADAEIIFRQQGTNRFLIGYDDTPAGYRIYDYSGTPGTRFFVAEGGNVGIGTTTPGFNAGGISTIDPASNFGNGLLHLEKTGANALVISGTTEAGIVLIDGGSNLNRRYWQTYVDADQYKIRLLNDVGTVAQNNILVCDYTGNVGIGTTSPQQKLQIGDGTTIADLRLLADNTTNDPKLILEVSGVIAYSLGIDNSDSDKLKIGASGTVGAADRLVIDSTGNVLINNALDVGGNGTFLKFKLVDIGDWNMDTTSDVSIAHGLTLANIRTARVFIRNDAGTTTYSLTETNATSGNISSIDSTNVNLFRQNSGVFDTTDFDSTSYNRGWIHIWYE